MSKGTGRKRPVPFDILRVVFKEKYVKSDGLAAKQGKPFFPLDTGNFDVL